MNKELMEVIKDIVDTWFVIAIGMLGLLIVGVPILLLMAAMVWLLS